MSNVKYVYTFGNKTAKEEPTYKICWVVRSELAEMCHLGLPVPARQLQPNVAALR